MLNSLETAQSSHYQMDNESHYNKKYIEYNKHDVMFSNEIFITIQKVSKYLHM